MAITGRNVTRDNRPIQIRVAISLLWAAWILSAAALCINQIFFAGADIGPGPVLGVVSLCVQAGMCVFVGRGYPAARAMAVAFMLIAVLPLQMLTGLIAQKAFFSAGYTLLSFVLKATSVTLLFASDSSRWFHRVVGVTK
jgi:hypothetical protein